MEPPTAKPVLSNICRPLANFSPNVWGDRFLSYNPHSSELKQAQEEQLLEELKREVKETQNDYMKQLQMVDTIQRLGIAHIFANEVDQALQNLFQLYHDQCKDNHDLYTVALSFRLLRQHGFRISCEVFDKFKDANGEFKVLDIQKVVGILEFFEATHLRIHGEDVLDHGYTFSRNYLESVLPSLCSPVYEQVHYALNQYSNWRGFPRLAARNHISIYDKFTSYHPGLLRLATLEFNRLQGIHKRELSDICRWWKSLHFATKLPFARDRIVECYFWSLVVYFEPEYALARNMFVKVHVMTSYIDDCFDAYGIFDELQLFADAVERWNMSCLDQLPDYLKLVYKVLLQIFEENEKELMKQGRSYQISYNIKTLKALIRAFYIEAKWREENYTPTAEEYLRTATVSCGYTNLIIVSLLGMGDVATREAFDWVVSEPNIVKAVRLICRLTADIVGHQFERQRVHIPSLVECYTEEHNVMKEKTIGEIKNQVESAWKELNEGLLQPTRFPNTILIRILNLARVIEVMYSKGDWYTHVGPEMQSFITQILVDPLPA